MITAAALLRTNPVRAAAPAVKVAAVLFRAGLVEGEGAELLLARFKEAD